jgi:hypothetical protein
MFRARLMLASLLLCVACGWASKSDSAATTKAAALPELRAPLDELRAWFDAHRGEARFLAILSPT